MFKPITVSATPVLTVHANYASGDYVGTSASPMGFALGKNNNPLYSGSILSAVLIDKAVQSIQTELWLFSGTMTPPADSAAWSISDDDVAKCIGVIPFGGTTYPYYASALNSVCPRNPVGLGFYLPSGSSLYGCLVTRGAPTYASGDLKVILHVWQD